MTHLVGDLNENMCIFCNLLSEKNVTENAEIILGDRLPLGLWAFYMVRY